MANYTIIGGDNKEYGPVSTADVRQWIAEGRLNAESRAKGEGDAEFRPLAQFPEFATDLAPQAAPGRIAPPRNEAMTNAEWEAEILARPPELKIGECLGAGFSFLSANAGFLIGAVLLTWIVRSVLLVFAVIIPVVGPILLLCFNGVVMGGFYLACLRRLRGENTSAGDVFCGFQAAFGQLVLAGLVAGLLAQIALVCCLILPGVYLLVAWSMAILIVADRKMFFWAGMELSRKVVTRVWFEMLVLLIVTFLPVAIFQMFNLFQTGRFFMDLWNQSGHNWQHLGEAIQAQASALKDLTIRGTVIGLGVWLVNLFFCAGVITRAYENLFGTKKP